MARKFFAVALFVSFLAMSTSGMMMFVIEKPSFTIQMHPVHKAFGVIMIVAVFGHLFYNYKALLMHFKNRSASVVGGILVVLMVVTYGVALNNKIPADIAIPLDELGAKASGH
jgi:hypothetical protein